MAGTFSDDEGNGSIMRVMFSICALIVFLTWAIISIRTNALISFQAWDVGLIGVLFGGKMGQKGFEVWKAKLPAPPCGHSKQ